MTPTIFTEDDIEAVLDCLRSGWLTMGPRTQAFEAGFAEYCGVPTAVSVSSGTAALHLALTSLGVSPGDDVLVSAIAPAAVAAAVSCAGARLVTCDVTSVDDLGIAADDLAHRITPGTKAVIASHAFGYSADLAALRSVCDARGLALIEDATEAIGAHLPDGQRAGTAGDAGCFSLSTTTQLPVGEGGMVISSDEPALARVRSLRSHAMTSVTWDRHRGHANTYDVVDIGFNFRLDEPRAALGLSRLGRLDADLELRRTQVRALRAGLAGLPGVEVPWGDEAVDRSAHHSFVFLAPDGATRDRLVAGLTAAGIEANTISLVHEEHPSGAACRRARSVADRAVRVQVSSAGGETEGDAVASTVRQVIHSSPPR